MMSVADFARKQIGLLLPHAADGTRTELLWLQQYLDQETIRVLVIGEMGRGKSTFLNALLGREVLAASPTPCLVINTITYGSQAEAVPAFGPQAQHAIPVDASADYVLDHAPSATTGPFERFTLAWPLDYLNAQRRVELIEYPNTIYSPDAPTYEAFMEAVATADVVIMLLACDSLLSNMENEFILNELLPRGHSQLIFVCNGLDRVRAGEHDHVREEGMKRLNTYDAVEGKTAFFISAIDILENNTSASLHAFEAALKERLTADQVESTRATRIRAMLDRILDDVAPAVEQANAQIAEQHQDLEQRLVHMEGLLAQLNERKDKLDTLIHGLHEEKLSDLSVRTQNYFEQLADKVRARLHSADTARSQKEVSEAVTQWFQEQVEQDFQPWLAGQCREIAQRDSRHIQRELSYIQETVQALREVIGSGDADQSALPGAEPTFENDIFKQFRLEYSALLDKALGDLGDVGKTNATGFADVLAVAIGSALIMAFMGIGMFFVIPSALGISGIFLYKKLSTQGRARGDAYVEKVLQRFRDENRDKPQEYAAAVSELLREAVYQPLQDVVQSIMTAARDDAVRWQLATATQLETLNTRKSDGETLLDQMRMVRAQLQKT